MEPPSAPLTSSPTEPAGAVVQPPAQPRVSRGFWAASTLLLLVFGWPLFELLRFSLGSELYSHLGLVPLASIYFAWINRDRLPAIAAPDRVFALVFGLLALAGAAAYLRLVVMAPQLAPTDVHVVTALTVVTGFIAICAWFLGRPRLRALSFPLGFLVFFSPIPTAWMGPIETFLQHGSAAVAYGIFQFSSTPVYREELLFVLPGFSMEVAPQCSGIHSSLALFITSIAGGYLFLRSRWKRAVLALAVIPLALVRNGFRVFVIGELCVRISPDMIHSWVHRQGGPFFFGLSLIPFSILLYLLYRSDRRAAGRRSSSE
jgi:exosortase C (VPDSG-CTERM-specific)